MRVILYIAVQSVQRVQSVQILPFECGADLGDGAAARQAQRARMTSLPQVRVHASKKLLFCSFFARAGFGGAVGRRAAGLGRVKARSAFQP